MTQNKKMTNQEDKLTLEIRAVHNDWLPTEQGDQAGTPVRVIEFAPLAVTLDKYVEIYTHIKGHYLTVQMGGEQ